MKTTQSFNDSVHPYGVVYRESFSSSGLKAFIEKETGLNLDSCVDSNGIIDSDKLCSIGLRVLGKKRFAQLKEKSALKQFADNGLWRLLKKNFGLDLVIPFITGRWTTGAIKGNLVVTTGHAGYAGQIGGVTTTPFTAMAYGTGSTAAAAGDTALGTEVARGAATITRVTTSVTNDTCQWVKSFTAGGTQSITEEGLFDNNTSGGNLLARQVFSAVGMILNDTIQFTHKIQS